MEKLEIYREEIADMSLQELLQWCAQTFGKRVALASSFGTEDQVLTAYWVKHAPKGRIFTLDTGRLFPETYETWKTTAERYAIRYEVGFPDASEIAAVVQEKGINFFRDSVEDRRACCQIRKLNPLRHILQTLDAWITGLRTEQSPTRADIERIEWDAAHNLYKINPLAHYSEQTVVALAKRLRVPVNPLTEKGFPSIGCACCTRSVAPGENIRDGRWWWETPDKKECGLHARIFSKQREVE